MVVWWQEQSERVGGGGTKRIVQEGEPSSREVQSPRSSEGLRVQPASHRTGVCQKLKNHVRTSATCDRKHVTEPGSYPA
ncbi:hypothetical protein OPQ81_001342 [Rhizoctonia solani]|nr:hypothetical protein OPQ81_001342 [Rhizoctonia solani]